MSITKVSKSKFEDQEYKKFVKWYVKRETKAVNRKCLRCEKDFKSVGLFNRVCERCKGSPNYCTASIILDFCP